MSKKPPTSKRPGPPETAKDKQPKPRRNYAVALAVEVPDITKAALGSRGYAEAGLFTHWAEIAGAELAASTLPIKLSFPRGKRDDGTLTIRCGGAAAVALQHDTPRVIERINGHFGYNAVARIRIEQGAIQRRVSVPPPPLTQREQEDVRHSVEGVADPEMRATLTRLGTAIRRRDKAPRQS